MLMVKAGSRSPSAKAGVGDPIPDKLYFKIGEVSELVGVQPHVLRYWEKEVPAIRPIKSPSNQRRYRRRDIELFREIRQLLYAERYTLLGARKRLAERDRTSELDVVELSPVPSQPPQAAGQPPAAPSRPGREGAAKSAGARQLPLGFAQPNEQERLARLRSGLRELIQLAGEEP